MYVNEKNILNQYNSITKWFVSLFKGKIIKKIHMKKTELTP